MVTFSLQNIYKGSKIFWKEVFFSCQDVTWSLDRVQKEYPSVQVGTHSGCPPDGNVGVSLECNDIGLIEKVRCVDYTHFMRGKIMMYIAINAKLPFLRTFLDLRGSSPSASIDSLSNVNIGSSDSAHHYQHCLMK